MTRPEVSVVSPVYGCTGCLEALYDAVFAAFDGTGIAWELVLVDDRGPDDPWPLIRTLSERDARVRGVRLARNHGQHLAIWSGFEEARGEWVAVIDCDLQDDPACIPDLLRRGVEEGMDAVVVDRGAWTDSRLRRLASRTFYAAVRFLAKLEIDANTGNFGLYSRRMVKTLLAFGDKEVFLPAMVALTGLPRTTHRLERAQRAAGKSSYSLRRMINLAILVIIRFSDRPLKLSIVAGLALSGVAALYSIYVLCAWSLGLITVLGWTSTILSVWFIGGLILAALGVQGYYLGRIFAEVQQRPRIIVEELTSEAEAVCEYRLVR